MHHYYQFNCRNRISELYPIANNACEINFKPAYALIENLIITQHYNISFTTQGYEKSMNSIGIQKYDQKFHTSQTNKFKYQTKQVGFEQIFILKTVAHTQPLYQYQPIRNRQNKYQQQMEESMLTSFKIDPNIQMALTIEQPYYVAGEYVKGCVYLNVRQNSIYHKLIIQVQGKENMCWISQENSAAFSNTYENYKSSFILRDFMGNLSKGSYAMPFTFLLPSMMSGSFFLHLRSYIFYFLRAKLTNPFSQKQSQLHEIPLNIIQPPRVQIKQATTVQTTNNQSCCCDNGSTKILMTVNKNFVTGGDTIQVAGAIDQSRCQADIVRSRVVLQQMLINISKDGSEFKNFSNEWPLHEINGQVLAGRIKNFQFKAKIPDIQTYTAIGRIIARYFLLTLRTEDGSCCAPMLQASASIHLIVNSRNPLVVPFEQKSFVLNHPHQTLPRIVCQQMKPFVNNPHPKNPYHNIPGKAVVIPAMAEGMGHKYSNEEGYEKMYEQGYEQHYRQKHGYAKKKGYGGGNDDGYGDWFKNQYFGQKQDNDQASKYERRQEYQEQRQRFEEGQGYEGQGYMPPDQILYRKWPSHIIDQAADKDNKNNSTD